MLRNVQIVLITSFLFISFGLMAETDAPKTFEGIWIDVRSPEEFAEDHIEGAIQITHTEIAERIAEVTTDKTATINVYCRSGNRSGKAKKVLEEMGYLNVINQGGLKDLKPKKE